MMIKYTITMYKYIPIVFEITKEFYFFEDYDAFGTQDAYTKKLCKRVGETK